MDSYNTEKHAIPSHCVEHMHVPCSGRSVDAAMCVMKSLPVVSISSYAPPAHCRASGAASGGALGRSAPPRAARAPPFSFLPNTEKLPLFHDEFKSSQAFSQGFHSLLTPCVQASASVVGTEQLRWKSLEGLRSGLIKAIKGHSTGFGSGPRTLQRPFT
jgi:hypothetical protein